MSEFMYEVYDQPTKERFLNNIDLLSYPPRWFERIFEKSAQLEKYNGKDLHSFTVNEILEFYKYLEPKSLSVLIVANANLTKYGQWAYGEHLITDGQNHFDEINTELLSECLSKLKLKNSLLLGDDFKHLINDMPNSQDKFVFYCLYEGIKGKNYEEIVKLRMEDLDFTDNTVHLPTRTMKVSRRFLHICAEADKEEKIEGITGKPIEIRLKPSIYGGIFKEKNNSSGANLPKTVFSSISRNVRRFCNNPYITSKSIRDSGLITALNERAESNNMSVEELLKNTELCQDILDKYQFKIKVKAVFLTDYGDFLV